jgi:hypothetical protein
MVSTGLKKAGYEYLVIDGAPLTARLLLSDLTLLTLQTGMEFAQMHGPTCCGPRTATFMPTLTAFRQVIPPCRGHRCCVMYCLGGVLIPGLGAFAGIKHLAKYVHSKGAASATAMTDDGWHSVGPSS